MTSEQRQIRELRDRGSRFTEKLMAIESQIERIEKSVIEMAELLQAIEPPNCAQPYYQKVIDRLKPTPEPTAFQKHMAKHHATVPRDSPLWEQFRDDWNAVIDAGIAKQAPGDRSLPWVAVSILEALKEPVE